MRSFCFFDRYGQSRPLSPVFSYPLRLDSTCRARMHALYEEAASVNPKIGCFDLSWIEGELRNSRVSYDPSIFP